MMTRVRILVNGLVQGVGFRYFVHSKAIKLGLKGYAKNLYTGGVEIEADGDRSLLEELIKEVKIGPRSSHVKSISVEWKSIEIPYTQFEIL